MIPKAYIDGWRKNVPWSQEVQFEQNLFEKRENPQFVGDINPLLTVDTGWDFEEAFQLVMAELISLLPGEPWQGRQE